MFTLSRPSKLVALAASVGALGAMTAVAPVASAGPPKAQAASWPFPTLKPAAKPLVVGHRGASGYLPEHTLAAYNLAIDQGADYIEPDLEATKDGVLVARHEPNIIATTDVNERPEFASRKKTVLLDGAPDTGFFVSDFTLAELKTLRAKQPLAERPQQYNGRFAIPTFEEVIDLAKRRTRQTGRTIGVFPETKHPTYHRSLGLALEPLVVRALKRARWNTRSAPVILQSFEPGSLKTLKSLSPVRRVQLIDADDVAADGSLTFAAPYDRPYDWTASGEPSLLARTFGYLTTNAGLDEVKRYADGIGPWKRYIVSTVADPSLPGTGEAARRLAPPSDLVARAHARGLTVIPYTFRNEPRRLAADYGTNPQEEYRQFYELGVDGVFSDFPDTAVTARTLLSIDALAAR
ncbi:MAG: glycerophosphodiester phosphodiesterase [Solirubrobacteraceae bacterium]|nr:glycerophosphodiester phosphodiesterase [Solirubrobacteraceae bacterium]